MQGREYIKTHFIVKISIASLFIIIYIIACIKTYKKLTPEQKKQPLSFILELFIALGYNLFFIGVIIFDNVLLSDLGIGLIFIGFIINSIQSWNLSMEIRSFKGLTLLLFVLTFYIFFVRELNI